MLLGALFRDHRFGGGAQHLSIAGRTRANQGHKKIAPRHIKPYAPRGTTFSVVPTTKTAFLLPKDDRQKQPRRHFNDLQVSTPLPNKESPLTPTEHATAEM
jgi:hypothetical protein